MLFKRPIKLLVQTSCKRSVCLRMLLRSCFINPNAVASSVLLFYNVNPVIVVCI